MRAGDCCDCCAWCGFDLRAQHDSSCLSLVARPLIEAHELLGNYAELFATEEMPVFHVTQVHDRRLDRHEPVTIVTPPVSTDVPCSDHPYFADPVTAGVVIWMSKVTDPPAGTSGAAWQFR